MVDPETVHTAGGALLAGLVTGFHCAGMCGPVACGAGALGRTASARQRSAVLYQLGRLSAYAAVGAVAGAVGQVPLEGLTPSPPVVLPWFLVALFVCAALGIHRAVPVPGFMRRRLLASRHRFSRAVLGKGAFAVGLAAPLLPCAPLYTMFGIALLSGSAVRGIEFMLAFGLGTMPLLWLAQSQFHRVREKLGAATFGRAQRGVALLAAGLMAWRLRGTLPWVEDTGGCLFCP